MTQTPDTTRIVNGPNTLDQGSRSYSTTQADTVLYVNDIEVKTIYLSAPRRRFMVVTTTVGGARRGLTHVDDLPQFVRFCNHAPLSIVVAYETLPALSPIGTEFYKDKRDNE